MRNQPTLPAALSISAPRGLEDYSLHARDYAVEIHCSYKINSTVDVNGVVKLTGWHEAARRKLLVFVSKPIDEAAALTAVRAMEQELKSTLRLITETEPHLLPILTDIPIGFRIIGTPKIVSRNRPRSVGYIADHVAAVRDAWTRAIAAFHASL